MYAKLMPKFLLNRNLFECLELILFENGGILLFEIVAPFSLYLCLWLQCDSTSHHPGSDTLDVVPQRVSVWG